MAERPLHGRLIWLGYQIGKRFRRVRGPVTLGVRVAPVAPDGRVLLVRHTYMDGWFFPGGRVDRGETLEQAVTRELREEVGLEVLIPPRLLTLQTFFEGRHSDHVGFFRAEVSGDLHRDWIEIADARFFSLDALPDGLHTSTVRQLKALREDSLQ